MPLNQRQIFLLALCKLVTEKWDERNELVPRQIHRIILLEVLTLSLTWIETGRAIPRSWDAGELNIWGHPSSPLADSMTTVSHALQLGGFTCVAEEKDPDFSAFELNDDNSSLSSQNEMKHLWCFLTWGALSSDLPVLSWMDLTPLGLHGGSGCLRKQGTGGSGGKIAWERGNTDVCL